MHGILEGLLRIDPAGAGGRFTHRLLRVVMHPLPLDQPGRHECLPEQVAEGPVGDRGRVEQLHRRALPLVGQFGQYRQSGADILASLGVVCRQRRHPIRCDGLAALLGVVELADCQAEPGG